MMKVMTRATLRVICSLCLVLALLFWGFDARAGQLANRLSQFPNWESKPPVSPAKGDLIYPPWMAGTWQVTSTLVDLAAPLAPKVVTPGFESNRQNLHRPVIFLVRFQPMRKRSDDIIADRAYNGTHIARAYLGDRAVQSVKVDPNNPNRQITFLRGDIQLVNLVTTRGTETPAPDEFITTEVAQQIFRSQGRLYLNEVETTTAYQYRDDRMIQAEQVTAIYLSPQDPDYFQALSRPVALYRYHLELLPINDKKLR